MDVRASKTGLLDDFTLEAYLDLLNASVSEDVLAVRTSYGRDAQGHVIETRRTPVGVRLVLPVLGLKGRY